MKPEHKLQLIISALREPQRLVEASAPQLDLTIRLVRRARLLGKLATIVVAEGLIDSLPSIAQDQLQSARVIAEAQARTARWELRCGATGTACSGE